MSKRRQQRLSMATPCGICEGPTRDHATLCPRCVTAFRGDLHAVAGLEDDLNISCTNEKGANLSPMPKGGGSAPDLNWPAIEARRDLRWTLGRGAAYAAQQAGQTAPDLPSLTARAEFIRGRLTALALDPLGPQLAMAVSDGITRARAVVDLRPARQYLGECACTGAMYAEDGQDVAVCRGCGAMAVAAHLRDDKLTALDDRLCTAAEIAYLVTHLGGSTADRVKVRKRINTWHARRTIHAAPGWGEPRFSFGIVRRLLEKS